MTTAARASPDAAPAMRYKAAVDVRARRPDRASERAATSSTLLERAATKDTDVLQGLVSSDVLQMNADPDILF